MAFFIKFWVYFSAMAMKPGSSILLGSDRLKENINVFIAYRPENGQLLI